MSKEMVQIPLAVYHRLLEHLEAQGATALVQELQGKVKPAYRTASGTYLLDSRGGSGYRVEPD